MIDFKRVVDVIDLPMLANSIGLRINRAGFASCPFHSDKSPSMKVYKDHYHCYACGASGDVFDLVEKVCDLTPTQAIEFCCNYAGGRSYFEIDNEAPRNYEVRLSQNELDLIGIKKNPKTMNGTSVLARYDVAVDFEPGNYDGRFINGEFLIYKKEPEMNLDKIRSLSPDFYYDFLIKKALDAKSKYAKACEELQEKGSKYPGLEALSESEICALRDELSRRSLATNEIAEKLTREKRRR